MKRIIFIIIGLIIILFARNLTFMIAPSNMDTEFYLLNILSFIVIGSILSFVGILYPFKDDKNN